MTPEHIRLQGFFLGYQKEAMHKDTKDLLIRGGSFLGAGVPVGVGTYFALNKLRQKYPDFFKREQTTMMDTGKPMFGTGSIGKSVTGDSDEAMEKGVMGQAAATAGVTSGLAALALAEYLNKRK